VKKETISIPGWSKVKRNAPGSSWEYSSTRKWLFATPYGNTDVVAVLGCSHASPVLSMTSVHIEITADGYKPGSGTAVSWDAGALEVEKIIQSFVGKSYWREIKS